MKESGEGTFEHIEKGGAQFLEKTRDDWKKWMADTTQLVCKDQRLVDLINDTKIIVKIQTADPQGAAGPMEFFAGTWVRDSNGPFLYYCRMGKLDAAWKMLDFYYRGSAYNKHIANFLPMDIDLTKPVDPNMDWTEVTNDPVEITNWLIMQHRRYYQYTGDLTPIKEHWGYLMKCLYGQLTNSKGEPVHYVNYGSTEPGPNTMYRFPHHGDETWIYPGFELLNSKFFPEPNDHPQWDQYSADSTWEFVVSAETLAELAVKIGRPEAEVAELKQIAKNSRDACERDYWIQEKGLYGPAMGMRSGDVHQPPFCMVNFDPLWIGYLKGDDPKAISNVVETMKYTMNPNYVTDATETLRVYVGMQPGMFLYNLAAIDHPYAEPALKAMVEVALPSGEYTEKLATERDSYKPVPNTFLGHRIRPWEGGINLDAAFYYFTGLEPDMGNSRIKLCPRLEAGSNEMAVTGQKLGDGKLDVSLVDNDGKRTYTMKWTGSKAITADFKISLPQAKINSVTLNGNAVAVSPNNRWGLTTATLAVPLPAGQTTTLVVDYAKEQVEPLKFVREEFKYAVPKNVPPYQMILWDGEPRKSAKPEDVRTFDLLNGKVNYRLISANNPTSADWLRAFMLNDNGTVKTPLFFMTPGSVPALKWSAWWGKAEMVQLLTEYMNAGGVIFDLNGGEGSSDMFGSLMSDSAYFTIPAVGDDSVPTEGAGKQICDLLSVFAGEQKDWPKTAALFIPKDMIVLARPVSEPLAATIMAKKFGKGCFITMSINCSYEQRAALAQKLVAPETIPAIAAALDTAKPESYEAAFTEVGQNGSYADNFQSYKEGSIGLPVWVSLSGRWQIKDGMMHSLNTNGYDFTATANMKVTGDYKVEFTAKIIEGIYEAGLMFNMPSRFSVSNSQMVRFCGASALWCGPIPFVLEHDLPTGVDHQSTEFHTLSITVMNSKGTYDLAVDGKVVGKDLKLTNILKEGQFGYLGLVSCRGHVAFNSFKVTPIK